MSKLSNTFKKLNRQGDAGLIVFVTAGDPNLETTVQTVLALEKAGVDAVELGIPFSDPLADGPVIQASSERGLQSGATIPTILDTVHTIRKHSQIPIVFMTYFNPVLQYGLESFIKNTATAGVDGVLLTDVPPEEAGDWAFICHQNAVDTIFLLAPTSTDERIQQVAEMGTGFIYCVSRTGVTGEREQLPQDLTKLVGRIRAHTNQPIVVGFGISQPEHVRAVCRDMPADAVVVGSAVVRLLNSHSNEPTKAFETLQDYIKGLKNETINTKRVR